MKRPTFLGFLAAKEQRRAIFTAAAAFVAAGLAWRWYFPQPFFFPDSEAYLLSAISGEMNVWRPIGYSLFLRLLHALNPSLNFVFVGSLTLHALTSLFFLLSARYLLGFGQRTFYALLAVAAASPSLLYLSNFLMSDGLFTSLTLLWLTLGWWTIARPLHWLPLAGHLLCLAALYAVRYTGMFYVPVSVCMLFLSLRNVEGKRARSVAYLLLLLPMPAVGLMHGRLKAEYSQRFGVATLAPFGGWQWLCNASALVPDVRDLDIRRIHGAAEQDLHRFLLTFPDSVYSICNALTTAQMWRNDLPLKQYLYRQMRQTGQPYPQSFARAGEVFGSYGRQLALLQPLAFARRFLWPSFLNLFRYPGDLTADRFAYNRKAFLTYYRREATDYAFRPALFRAVNPLRRIGAYLYAALLPAALLVFFVGKRRAMGECVTGRHGE